MCYKLAHAPVIFAENFIDYEWFKDQSYLGWHHDIGLRLQQ